MDCLNRSVGVRARCRSCKRGSGTCRDPGEPLRPIVVPGLRGLVTSTSTRIPGLIAAADLVHRERLGALAVPDPAARVARLQRRFEQLHGARRWAYAMLAALTIGAVLVALWRRTGFWRRFCVAIAPVMVAVALLLALAGAARPEVILPLLGLGSIALAAAIARAAARGRLPRPRGAAPLPGRPVGVAGDGRLLVDRPAPRAGRPLLRGQQSRRDRPAGDLPALRGRARPRQRPPHRGARARHRRLEPDGRRRRRADRVRRRVRLPGATPGGTDHRQAAGRCGSGGSGPRPRLHRRRRGQRRPQPRDAGRSSRARRAGSAISATGCTCRSTS